MFDVSIIGAGITGASIARELSKYDLSIALIDLEPDFGFGATRANSAIVHAGYDDAPDTLKSRLCVRGNSMMERICAEVDVDFDRNGCFVVAMASEEEKTVEELYERGLKNGVPGMRIMDRNEVLRKEPKLNENVRCALFAPSAGTVLPYELATALAENAIGNGVKTLLETRIVSAEWGEEKITLTDNKKRNIKSMFVINAAGLYADNVAKLFGVDDFYIYPRRGEYFLFDKEIKPLVNSTIFPTPTKNGKGILVTKTCENIMLIGPNAVDLGMDEKDNVETTKGGLDEVFEGARKVVPEIGNLKKNVIKNFAGNRPQSSRKDFIIEQRGNLINVAGIQSPGLTAAPAIGEYVTEMLRYSMVLRKRSNFNPFRKRIKTFRNMSNEERNRAIKKDPRYGHIVCRCEHVSEAEVVEAIRRGARTLDGIKFRTRCSMGRCQGGFDLPFVIAIMERELRINAREIRKNRTNSEMIKADNKELLRGKE